MTTVQKIRLDSIQKEYNLEKEGLAQSWSQLLLLHRHFFPWHEMKSEFRWKNISEVGEYTKPFISDMSSLTDWLHSFSLVHGIGRNHRKSPSTPGFSCASGFYAFLAALWSPFSQVTHVGTGSTLSSMYSESSPKRSGKTSRSSSIEFERSSDTERTLGIPSAIDSWRNRDEAEQIEERAPLIS